MGIVADVSGWRDANRLSGLGPGDHVPGDDDAVQAPVLNIVQHRLQSGKIAVDTGQYGET
jgi:hypothetical protein